MSGKVLNIIFFYNTDNHGVGGYVQNLNGRIYENILSKRELYDRAKTLLIFGYVTNPICAWYDALAIAE